MDGERFIVTGYTYRMHGSYRAAYREAKRLSASYPKAKFSILAVREPDPKPVQNEIIKQDKDDGKS